MASSPVSRFISRHIFDLPLNETGEDDLVEVGKQMHLSTVETMIKDNEESIEHERRGMRVKMGHESKVLRRAEDTFNRKKNHPILRQARDECIMTKITVPLHANNWEKIKRLDNQEDLRKIICSSTKNDSQL